MSRENLDLFTFGNSLELGDELGFAGKCLMTGASPTRLSQAQPLVVMWDDFPVGPPPAGELKRNTF